MEKFQELRDIAKKKITIADHMLSVTYPLLNETKILVSVMENVFLAYTNAMGSLLYYEGMFKRIPPFEDNFESKFNMLKQRCVDKHNMDKKYLLDMQDMKNLLLEHKKSPVEFVRKDRFVICSDKFNMKSISVSDMQRYIKRAKLFIQDTASITSKNEGLFR